MIDIDWDYWYNELTLEEITGELHFGTDPSLEELLEETNYYTEF